MTYSRREFLKTIRDVTGFAAFAAPMTALELACGPGSGSRNELQQDSHGPQQPKLATVDVFPISVYDALNVVASHYRESRIVTGSPSRRTPEDEQGADIIKDGLEFFLGVTDFPAPKEDHQVVGRSASRYESNLAYNRWHLITVGIPLNNHAVRVPRRAVPGGYEGIPNNVGRIEAYDLKTSVEHLVPDRRVAIVVMGRNPQTTINACKVVANFNNAGRYNVHGKVIDVEEDQFGAIPVIRVQP